MFVLVLQKKTLLSERVPGMSAECPGTQGERKNMARSSSTHHHRHRRGSRSSPPLEHHRTYDARHKRSSSRHRRHDDDYSRSPERASRRTHRSSSRQHGRGRHDEDDSRRRRVSRRRDYSDEDYHAPRGSSRSIQRRRGDAPHAKSHRRQEYRRRNSRSVTARPRRASRSKSSSYKRPSPEKPPKRAWKFDSPPRDEMYGYGSGTGVIASAASGPLDVNGVPGMISQLRLGDTPTQPSSMGVMAQSLGLTCEQQKAARELYVGNLPPNLDVNQLIDFFNAAMLTLNSSGIPGNPVSRAWIAADGHFAFVEFRTIEEATIALQLNGLNCMGYTLRIGRPKTYPSEYSNLLSSTSTTAFTGDVKNPAAAALAAATAAAATVGNAPALRAVQLAGLRRPVIEKPDRLVILDLPPSATFPESKVLELLQTYGRLKVFQYFEVPESETSQATGVCVFEYAELGQQKALEKSVKERSNDDLEIRIVSAEQAIREGRLTDAMQKAGGDLVKPQVPTQVIMLTNLVTRSELMDDKEYFDIVDDVTVECSQYGKVLGVEIPRPTPGSTPGQDDTSIGYAFVKFSKLQEAGAARKGLSGRKFAGRTVEAHYFSGKKFEERDFKDPRPNFDVSGRLNDLSEDEQS